MAVTGVSRTPSEHGGNVVYTRLRERGYDVVPINPHSGSVEGDPCYADLRSVPGGVEAVVIATRPEEAAGTLEECAALGVTKVWMHRAFGAGSVDHAAAEVARSKGITVIEGGCPLMCDPVSDPGHKVIKAVCRLTGAVPRTV